MEDYKWYLPQKEHQEAIQGLLEEVLANYTEEEKQYICDSYGCDDVEELVEKISFMKALQDNDCMNRYIHADSQKIEGNFGRLDQDFAYHYTKQLNPDSNRGHTDFSWKEEEDAYNNMKLLLDAGTDNDTATSMRLAIEDWYWWAFGTYNYKYNIGSDFDNLTYELHCEEDDEE